VISPCVSKIKPVFYVVDVYLPPLWIGSGCMRVTISNSSGFPDEESGRLRFPNLSHNPGVRLNVRFYRVKRGQRLYSLEKVPIDRIITSIPLPKSQN